jgi:hypothetical protein
MGNRKLPLLQDLRELPRVIIASLVFLGVTISTASTLYLSGWSGGAAAKSTTVASISLFFVFCFYYLWIQINSPKFTPFVSLSLISIPPVSIIVGVAGIKKDFSFIVGVLVFLAVLGLGRLATLLFAPSSKLKFLAYLPVGQLTILSAYLMLQSRISLFIITCVLMFIGLTSILIKVIKLKKVLTKVLIGQQEKQPYSFFIPSLLSLLSILLIGAHSPILGFDALSMKLWLPKIWRTNDSVFLPTDHLLSGVSGSFSFPVLASYELGGISSGNAFQFLSLAYVTLVMLIYLNESKKKYSFSGKLLVIILIGVPASLFQISNSYDDLWMMAILFCGVLFAQANSSSNNLGQTFFSAFVIGAIATAKFSLMPVVIAAATIFGIQKFLSGRFDLFQRLRILTVAASGFLLSLIPFYGWKWANYGNPVWPLFNKIFKAPGAPFENIKFNLPYSELGYFEFLFSPITTVVRVSQWGEEGAPGSYNSIYTIILLSLILSLIAFYKSPHKIVLITNIAFVFNWFANFRYSRYLLHIFPLSIVTILLLVRESKKARITPKFLRTTSYQNFSIFSVGLLCAASFTIGNPANPERIPYKHIFSYESMDEYLNKVSPNYRTIEYLNSALPRNAMIVSPQLFERAWFREDINLYHFWESTDEISQKSWKIFITDNPIYPDQFYECSNSIISELYTISPPACERETLTTDPNS